MIDVKEARQIAAFASPIEWYQVAGAEQLNAGLVAEIATLMKQSDGVKRSNRNGWHSDPDLFKRPEKHLKTLCEIISSCVLRTNARNFSEFDIARNVDDDTECHRNDTGCADRQSIQPIR